MKFKIALLILLVVSSIQTSAQAFMNANERKNRQAGPLQIKALEIIQTNLKSEFPLLRMHAIEAVANSREMSLMPTITKMLDDKDEPVRFAAVLAIGDTQYSAASYALKKRKSDPAKSVQVAISYVLTKFEVGDYRKNIIAGMKSNNQTLKANSALVAGKLGDDSLAKYLHEILKDRDSMDKAKIQAIESLAMLNDISTYQKGWALLISKRADDRVMGIRTMEQMGGKDAISAIATMYRDDLIEVQMAAAASLAKLGDPQGPQRIYQYFKFEFDKLDRETRNRANVQATIGLGYCNQPQLTKYLKKMLKDKMPTTRLYAAQSALIKAKTTSQIAY